MSRIDKRIIAPFFYTNWAMSIDRGPSQFAWEHEFFTDVRPTGDLTVGIGPYKIFNTIPTCDDLLVAPAVVFRYDSHSTSDVPDLSKTNANAYHGGDIADEVASLVSLLAGFRLKASGPTRMFWRGKDPRGIPVRSGPRRKPLFARSEELRPIVPNALGKHSIKQADVMKHILKLKPEQAAALIKASRSYQEALWVCESAPHTAWLLLVSSVEVIASFWRADRKSPVDRVRQTLPDLEKVLLKAGGEDLVSQVADLLAPLVGATRTFVDFLLKYLPPPPDRRPPECMQVEWSPAPMKKALKMIYHWRSRALHGGIPFPAPMCMPLESLKGVYAEKPSFRAMSAKGGTWVAASTPMTLNTFEYIVRNALRNWIHEKVSA